MPAGMEREKEGSIENPRNGLLNYFNFTPDFFFFLGAASLSKTSIDLDLVGIRKAIL